MIDSQAILSKIPLKELFERFPYLSTCFDAVKIEQVNHNFTFIELINSLSEARFKEFGYTKRKFTAKFLETAIKLQQAAAWDPPKIAALKIIGGTDKDGIPEEITLTIKTGEMICIVGPTGAGKSRLLSDIECLAQCDTVTHRRVLLLTENGNLISEQFDTSKMIAQLSQGMNFILDMPVDKFICYHAKSHGQENPNKISKKVIDYANRLSGEQFSHTTSLVQLSGGQSRALMIADVALVSPAPIILIDEIENAGIDKIEAIRLLKENRKIILMSTHDPLLALQGNRRIVIRNGGITAIVEQCESDQANIRFLTETELTITRLRDQIRHGNPIESLHQALK